MTLGTLGAYTAVAALLTITPGADTMLVIRNVVRRGRGAGVRTTLGICSGLFVHATFSALGLSAILATSAAAFAMVKFAGALYLAWLGIQSLRARPPARRDSSNEGRGSWRDGFLTNLLNPKVAVFYLAFLPQFVGPGDPMLLTFLLLAAIHGTLGLVWLGSLSLAVDGARGFVSRPGVSEWLERVSGAVLIGLGARLALSRR